MTRLEAAFALLELGVIFMVLALAWHGISLAVERYLGMRQVRRDARRTGREILRDELMALRERDHRDAYSAGTEKP